MQRFRFAADDGSVPDLEHGTVRPVAPDTGGSVWRVTDYSEPVLPRGAGGGRVVGFHRPLDPSTTGGGYKGGGTHTPVEGRWKVGGRVGGRRGDDLADPCSRVRGWAFGNHLDPIGGE